MKEIVKSNPETVKTEPTEFITVPSTSSHLEEILDCKKIEHSDISNPNTNPDVKTYIGSKKVGLERFWGKFNDVTFHTSDQQVLKASKLALAQVSEYFADLFLTSSDDDEFIVQEDHRTLFHILHLAYFGEVLVPIEDEKAFLDAIDIYKLNAEDKDRSERKRRYPFCDWTSDQMLAKYAKCIDNAYICTVPKCLAKLKSRAIIRTHFLDKHIELGLIFECPLCLSRLGSRNAFRVHFAKKHPGIPSASAMPEPKFQE